MTPDPQPEKPQPVGGIPTHHRRPPNIEKIAKAFPAAYGPGVVFAYDGAIYSPSGDVPPEIFAHECVHLNRQAELDGGADEWWDKYIADPDFRYHEELLAHAAEYEALVKLCNSRPARRHALRHIGKKLSAPLYRYNVTLARAMRDIKAQLK